MRRSEVVLCVGMHRSGTSLTASMLESLGVCLPGELIAADSANQSGYFENKTIVAAQEKLLRELGYWWPTERASRGIPASVVQLKVYKDYVDWLTNHLYEILAESNDQIAIKDPRTSLLIPAWRHAAVRLGLSLRAVICIRDPRDVCWSLVWRDGPSVGMTWSRAQRLWMRHYQDLLNGLGEIPSFVVRYENWLNPNAANNQLTSLAKFVGRNYTSEQREDALNRVRPEFNHGGVEQLPQVHNSLRWLHANLIKPNVIPTNLDRQARLCGSALEVNRILQAMKERTHLIWLRTPWGRRSLGPALDLATIREQLGTDSLKSYRRSFRNTSDLRPHPLISPAHLNRERMNRGLAPIKNADDLFRHLLYPDLLPLDTHPWFECRYYQEKTGELGKSGIHPILRYLKCKVEEQTSQNRVTRLPIPWLMALGANHDQSSTYHIPKIISHLHPKLVLADPYNTLCDPSDGNEQLIAHERYWKNIQELFNDWPSSDHEGPLHWLSKQPNSGKLGLTSQKPASGYQLWHLPGHWEASLLADMAGADISKSRIFHSPVDLYKKLRSSMQSSKSMQGVLIALTNPLLELFLAESIKLPEGAGILNLVWPRPSQQSQWLHLLAQASLVVECRAEIRSYLQGLGLKAEWPRRTLRQSNKPQLGKPTLLLAMTSGPAEAQLAAAAERLNADRYNAILRLDAELQLRDPVAWLKEQLHKHKSWVWLNPVHASSDPKSHALIAWAHEHDVNLILLPSPPETLWLKELEK